MSAPAELALATDGFLEPRRDDCPWCGSRSLRTRLSAEGYTLDACHDCAHAFQNPGPTRHRSERAYGRRRLLAAARAMLPYGEPESWLDVGTGAGEFPAAAKEVFPYTSFDGVDPTGRVERARAADRVEEGYAGDLTNPHLMAHVRGRYDVVSVLRHLPQAKDPRALLSAAVAALRPGGHLLLELPDPHTPLAQLLGRWTHPRTRPRHLIPPDNVRAELDILHCEIVPPARRIPVGTGGHRLVARLVTRAE
ncbi:methyltransferase domain-containing protein [Streptomyces sp. NPDC003635]